MATSIGDIDGARWNPTGVKTLFLKEVRRWWKVWAQTIISPLMTTSLYFLVFGVALGSRLKTIDGVPYIQFVIPGLVMLSLINNAFLNTSSSLFQSKMNGTVIDILVAPLGTGEIVLAYVGAAMLRAILVGSLVFGVAIAFVGFQVAHPVWAVVFVIAVSATFAIAGMVAAIWATKYDHLSLFPNFILTPLTFLGGVFYSVSMLPSPWDSISRANPILYMVNGLRYGLLGISDIEPWVALGAVAGLFLFFSTVCWRMLSTGYNLRD